MPAEQTLREEVARAIAKEMTGGYPSKPKLIDYAAADATIAILLERSRAAETENAALRAALHDAINRPKGVVPASAEPFYRALATDGRAA